MAAKSSGFLPRTPEEASGGRQQAPRASTSTSSSLRNQESPQMNLEALHDIVEGSHQHDDFTTPCETTPAASPSIPLAREPDAPGTPTQRAAVIMRTQGAAAFNLSGSGELLASPPTRCIQGDPKQLPVPQTQMTSQPLVKPPQTQEEQKHQQQHRQKQEQKKQQQGLLLLPLALPLGERCADGFWPGNLARRPSAEMMQHLRVAADRHQLPNGALISVPLSPATPAGTIRAAQDVPAEVTTAGRGRATPVAVVASQKISGDSTKTGTVNNDCGVADGRKNGRSNRMNNNSSWLGTSLPRTGGIPRPVAGVLQPRGDCSVGPCDAVSASRSAATSSSTATATGAIARTEVCATVNFTSAKKTGAPDGPVHGALECPVEPRSSRNYNRSSNDNSTNSVQRLCCDIGSVEKASSEVLKCSRGLQRQPRNASTLDALVPSNVGFDSNTSIHLREQQGVQDLVQQPPHKQPDMLHEKTNQSQQEPQGQKQQQRPREFVRRLALGLLLGHRAGGKERRAWLSRCNSSSRISQAQQEQQLQHRQQEQQRRQQQKQQEDGVDWEACCLLQPADEKKGGLAATSRSNSSSGTRRAPSRLQRMAFSFGCFGEASQRRTEAQREDCRSLTPSQYRAWRKQQEAYADEGSLFPRGLANLKNTCFLNAALQALAGIPSFVASLQAGLPPEPAVRDAQWKENPKAYYAFHDGNTGAASATAAAACSSTTASRDSEEARCQQAQQLQHQSDQQAQQQKDLLQQYLLRRQELLRRLRLQQERREKHQPECLGSLDENQRRLLLREFFTLLCRLTCCPSIRPHGSADETSPEDLAAQRPRESNSAATYKPEQQQQEQRQPHNAPVLQYDTIRPERLRRALVAPLAGLLLNDCNMQQQQDCHEFLRGLIDLIHEIFKASRWEREEAAAAEQLLQLQAISPVDLEPWALSSFSSLRLPLAVDDDQQMQYHKKQIHAQPTGIPTEDNEASEPGEAVGGDAGDAERAEKKWREYIRDQASPMADFFAGQLCSEIQCAGCRQSLFIYEPAWDLSLPLPVDGNRVSLNNLLEGFFGSEELEFSCSSCHSPACKAHRTIRYTHPPKVLLLQIKRFSASGQKRRTRVEYPLEELVIKTKGKAATFRLIAVIEHNGNSCQSGHYVAYVRRRRFVIPVALPPSTAEAASGRPETPRSSACSPSEFLKRIGILKGFSSFASHSLRHPNGPSTAPLSGPSPREPPHESPFRPPRQAMSFEGMADDGTEWFRFDDGLVLPVSEAEVFSAEAYCLFYSRTNDTEKQWSTASKQES